VSLRGPPPPRQQQWDSRQPVGIPGLFFQQARRGPSPADARGAQL